MSILSSFISRDSVVAAGPLPLVHSTQATHIKRIVASGKIEAAKCDVFVNEDLTYFFVGRPAYKRANQDGQSEYWELPCCFIFDFDGVANIRRVFPFDSGAFAKGRLPSYVTCMPLEEFNAGEVLDAPSKLIGAFFGTVQDYFRLAPKPKDTFEREFDISIFDDEIRAIHKLAVSGSQMADDRRFTIEVQSSTSLDLSLSKPMAVIAPSIFFEDSVFRNHVERSWGAQPIGYPMHSLSMQNYHGLIYEAVSNFYKSCGLL